MEIVSKTTPEVVYAKHTLLASCLARVCRVLQKIKKTRSDPGKFGPGEAVVFQGSLPRPEDGHFTLLRGACDCVHLVPESVAFSRLQGAIKARYWDKRSNLS